MECGIIKIKINKTREQVFNPSEVFIVLLWIKKKQSYEYFRRVSPSTRSFGDCNHGHNIVIGSKLSLCLRKLYSRHKANLEPISIQYLTYIHILTNTFFIETFYSLLTFFLYPHSLSDSVDFFNSISSEEDRYQKSSILQTAKK